MLVAPFSRKAFDVSEELVGTNIRLKVGDVLSTWVRDDRNLIYNRTHLPLVIAKFLPGVAPPQILLKFYSATLLEQANSASCL